MSRYLLLCVLVLPSLPALADPPTRRGPPRVAQGDRVSCTIRSILAHQGAGGIDKRLAFLRKQLSKPPFSAYKAFQLVESRVLAIPRNVTRETSLPTKKLLKVTFLDKLLVKKKVRLRLNLTLKPRLKNTKLTIADGGTLVLAGDKYKNGVLVVGVTCSAK